MRAFLVFEPHLSAVSDMQNWLGLIVLLPTLGLLASGLVPSEAGVRRGQGIVRWIQFLTVVQMTFAFAVATGWLMVGGGQQPVSLFPANLLGTTSQWFDKELSLLLNGGTVMMFGLISFIGWVICQYSTRYLDGDANQVRFFKHLAVTLACVSLLVWSGSLFAFMVAWFAVSLNMHPLLLHFEDRRGARRAAWLKFAISRAGELLLLSAVLLLQSYFGTTNFATIGDLAASMNGGERTILSIACWLVVSAVVLKTAQFPFHAWLPQTLETPTPVSALMHAGVVNAGGFLMIRVGQWYVLDSSSLVFLTAVGVVTAIYGAIVMTTQPTVKQQLAYSTIAQMGFMLLQCGLGAFSAAMLHLVAHSLYKAHAFLSSGDVLQDRLATQLTNADSQATNPFAIALQTVTSLVLLVTSGAVLFLVASTKAAAAPLFIIWGAAICYYLIIALKTRFLRTIARSLLMVGFLANVYAISLYATQKMLSVGGQNVVGPSTLSLAFVIVGFGVLILWHIVTTRSQASPWLRRVYIHALNGFYIEAGWRRILASR